MKLASFIALLLAVCMAMPAFAQVTDAEQPTVRNDAPVPLASTPRRVPLAYGFVNQDGSKASGTTNFTVSWNPSSSWYEIKIGKIKYYYSNYSTVVTVAIPHLTFCHTDSFNGLLLIRCYTASGSPTQAAFGFGTF